MTKVFQTWRPPFLVWLNGGGYCAKQEAPHGSVYGPCRKTRVDAVEAWERAVCDTSWTYVRHAGVSS